MTDDPMFDVVAHLTGAAYSYRLHAKRDGDTVVQPDPFFTTRARDYDRAAYRGREALQRRTDLAKHVEGLIAKHDGLRAAGRALGIPPSCLCKMRQGQQDTATEGVLKKLGLRRFTYYEKIDL